MTNNAAAYVYTKQRARIKGNGRIRCFLAGLLLGAVVTGSVAFYQHQQRACMTDSQIAEYMRGH